MRNGGAAMSKETLEDLVGNMNIDDKKKYGLTMLLEEHNDTAE